MSTEAHDVDDLGGLADLTAAEASAFLTSVTEVASGSSPDTALPLLTLALSQVLVAGARLGAIQDVVPEERFEPDATDDDADPLRTGLANVFAGIDDYVYVLDPITSSERADGSITNDLVDVAVALSHGLKHYAAGRKLEALWWWQFSYLSEWGDRAMTALRALQSILSHLRLDADEEAVGEAEFDALHP
ncbi:MULTISPECIES: DUF5063 domain-containing protein [unclassified Terrabacter]|uniref:DUF5063 domain-containing protein n=1 Tax=unclassified Terrabacter TaxID=2630222 RepID=UPI0006F33B13|nr:MULTISPECIES: DUF5063 domain-containing protein [unclassified Terrabacter]KRB43060.1 hypothetical protein ASD90_22025 [Terrabacter sp. Root181]KRF46716.1 hypothetical protein ASG96_01375 [Terrabacter sp. Soil810]